MKNTKYITLTFPDKTAKEIMEECNNKLGDGKLLFSPEGWYRDEDFFTKEKCRAGKVEASTELDKCKTRQSALQGRYITQAF